MRRGLTQSAYCARTAVRGLWSSPVTSGVAVATIGMTLVLVGAFALLLRNMEALLDDFGDDLRVTAYLDVEISPDEQAALAARVAEFDGVESVDTVSADEALERFRASVGGSPFPGTGMSSVPGTSCATRSTRECGR